MSDRVFIVVCAGSRRWTDHAAIGAAMATLKQEEPFALVVHGGAPGADRLVDTAARLASLHVAAIRPVWETGPQAGHVRNRVMLDLAPNYVIAFRSSGDSPGTDGTIAEARKRGIYVTVFHEAGLIERFPPPESLLDADV